MSGEHVLHGFTNRELREHLARAGFPLAPDPAQHSGQVTRLLRRLHIHQLVAKIPRLVGAFLLCARLWARVDVRALLQTALDRRGRVR